LTHRVTAQYFASTYRPKNNTEKTIIAKIKALPEIKEWYKTTKKSDPDLLINIPDSPSENYRIQVGISNLNQFRTSYHLSINPKNLQVYYEDFFDESGDKSITLAQWRHWRSNPGFNKPHKWVNGKLVVLKDR